MLLVLELVFCTIRFDTGSIEDIDLPWATMLGQLSLVGKFAISIVAAIVVFSGHSLANSWRQKFPIGAVDFGRRIWLFVAFHLSGAVAFYWLTAELLERGMVQSPMAPAWIAAWGVAAGVAVSGWALALLPFATWRFVFSCTRGLIAVGIAVSLATVFAGKAVDYFWPLLSAPTLDAVAGMLRLFYDDLAVYPEELLIKVRDFTAMIDSPCSGFEGVGLIGVFLAAFIWAFRKQLKFPQVLVVLPIGMALIWIANIIRLAALIAIGASISPPIAMGGFHSQAGWLAFNAIALSFIYVVWKTPVFRPSAAGEAVKSVAYEYAAGPFLAPLLMLLAVMMIATAMSALDFDWLYPVRVVATLVVIAWYLPTYRRLGYLSWSWSWTPFAIGVAVFAMWMLLEPFSGVDGDASKQQAQALSSITPMTAALWLAFRAVGSILTVPIAEELAFRGYLTRRFIADNFEQVPLGAFTWYSLILSSILFGLLHGRWLAGSLAGALFAAALFRRGRMLDAIIAHSTANAFVTVYVLYTQNWAAWS
jgi:exosortase E/protease (VPEID-CTERM system)